MKNVSLKYLMQQIVTHDSRFMSAHKNESIQISEQIGRWL